MYRAVFLFLCLLLVLGIVSISLAQDTGEQLTITTYYPSPYGVYKNLRLFPYDATNFVVEGDCGATGTNNQQGDLAYSLTENKPLYCDGTKWKAFGGGAGGGGCYVSYGLLYPSGSPGAGYPPLDSRYCLNGFTAKVSLGNATYCKSGNSGCTMVPEGVTCAAACFGSGGAGPAFLCCQE